ncbi:hypothetical protein EalM132_00167 [Exiguobacterium phage vB_EalM-132]|nr:hypothetical protein EalM132_00167 [Exiguobacterium phage vB_EalM-132]
MYPVLPMYRFEDFKVGDRVADKASVERGAIKPLTGRIISSVIETRKFAVLWDEEFVYTGNSPFDHIEHAYTLPNGNQVISDPITQAGYLVKEEDVL